MKSKSIAVIAGVSSRGIFGPFFFENTVTGPSFLNMMREEIMPEIREKFGDDCWFQMDGAPAHWARNVREWIEEQFPQRWIGRGGPINWPPRSPDLTPPDFFLWGHLKNKVFSSPPATLESLKSKIRTEMREISSEICQVVCRSVKGRLERCIAAQGSHVYSI
jgi:hypothetical protein